jgi:hypothetical protein
LISGADSGPHCQAAHSRETRRWAGPTPFSLCGPISFPAEAQTFKFKFRNISNCLQMLW